MKYNFLKALIAFAALFCCTQILDSQQLQAQILQQDTIRESRLGALLEALGNKEAEIVADDELIEANRFSMSLGVGINAIQAEGNDNVNNVWERRRARLQLSADYWVNRYFGVKGQFGIGKISAYYLAGGIFSKPLNSFDYPDYHKQHIINHNGLAYYRRKFTYIDLNVSAMTDVIKWFDKDNLWSVKFYGGPLATYSFNSQGFGSDFGFGFKVGSQIDYRINEHFSIMADIQGNFVSEAFDGIVGGEGTRGYEVTEGYIAAAMGVSYYFNDTPGTTALQLPVIYEDTYIPQPKRIKEVQAPAKEIIEPFVVRFFIDKSYIEKGQKPHINKIAEYMKANPETRIMLAGYADKETAYPEYNMRLSKKRIESVKKYLMNECGIAEERIDTDAKGDTERVYDEDFRWNRVVVMTIIEK